MGRREAKWEAWDVLGLSLDLVLPFVEEVTDVTWLQPEIGYFEFPFEPVNKAHLGV